AQDKKPDPTVPEPTLDAFKAKYAQMSGEEALMDYATGGATKRIPQAKSNAQLNADQAKAVGAVLIAYEKTGEELGLRRPDVHIKGSDGKKYPLEPKELSAYLQSATQGADKGVTLAPVNEWVQAAHVGLTGFAAKHKLKNGDERILIETGAGQSRTVSNGVITKPLDGYYGGVKGVKVGDGDLLDIYISKAIHNEIAAGKSYEGPVFVMQQMDKKKPDELKVGYAKDVNEFRAIQESTWDKPKDFETLNEGKYVQLTQEQYRDLKEAIGKNPKLTLDDFITKEKDKGITIPVVSPAAPAVGAASVAAATPQKPAPVSVSQEDQQKTLFTIGQQVMAAITKGGADAKAVEDALGIQHVAKGRDRNSAAEIESGAAVNKMQGMLTAEGIAKLNALSAALANSGIGKAQTVEAVASPTGGKTPTPGAKVPTP
ncbi:MAG: hypothetical protein B7X02_02335, partial [Rhodospirillales bacterium 12-54-5]